MRSSAQRSPLLPPPSCMLSGDGGGKDGLGSYRYRLTIPLRHEGPMVLFVLANPSTARVVDGEFDSDPTVTRCINYALDWQYATVVIANVRAWRETNPKLVPPDPRAIGPENDRHIEGLARAADLVICGWGRLGGERGPMVLDIIRRAGKVPHALRLLEGNVPAHPLYLPNASRADPDGVGWLVKAKLLKVQPEAALILAAALIRRVRETAQSDAPPDVPGSARDLNLAVAIVQRDASELRKEVRW